MLNGKLALHDVPDVEQLCAEIIFFTRGTRYTGHEHEDLLAWCIVSVWELSADFDPGRGVSFRTFAKRSVRIADWERQRFGRTRWVFATHVYERPRPVVLPLHDQSGLAQPGGADDLEAGGFQVLLGLDGAGGGQGDGLEGDGGAAEDGVAA